MGFKKVRVGVQWIILDIIMSAIGIFIITHDLESYTSIGGVDVSSYVDGNVSGGVLFLVLGNALLIINILVNRSINKLIKNNKYVICTDISHETKETGMCVRGDGTSYPVYSYFTVCKYTDAFGNTHVFESEHYKEEKMDPFLNMTVIYVFVDLETKPGTYYMYPYVI